MSETGNSGTDVHGEPADLPVDHLDRGVLFMDELPEFPRSVLGGDSRSRTASSLSRARLLRMTCDTPFGAFTTAFPLGFQGLWSIGAPSLDSDDCVHAPSTSGIAASRRIARTRIARVSRREALLQNDVLSPAQTDGLGRGDGDRGEENGGYKGLIVPTS